MAKVLYVNGISIGSWTDPDVVKAYIAYSIVQTGEDHIEDGFEFETSAKLLGLWKTALQLNANVMDAVEAHALANHSVSGFNHRLALAFSTL